MAHLARRAAIVLTTALRAMQLLDADDQGRLGLSELARRHLLAGSPFFVGDYIGLAAESPGVLEMVQRLKTNRPAGAEDEQVAAFVYRDGIESAMDLEAAAPGLSLAFARRAKNVTPYFQYVRVFYDFTSGDGTLDASINEHSFVELSRRGL